VGAESVFVRYVIVALMKPLMLFALFASLLPGQSLSPKWEELTAEDFVKAIKQANYTGVLPFGILEKHGPSGPIGTDPIDVRYITTKAVQKEYALVFPEYYVGKFLRRGISRARSPIAPSCNCRCRRKPCRRWAATGAIRF